MLHCPPRSDATDSFRSQSPHRPGSPALWPNHNLQPISQAYWRTRRGPSRRLMSGPQSSTADYPLPPRTALQRRPRRLLRTPRPTSQTPLTYAGKYRTLTPPLPTLKPQAFFYFYLPRRFNNASSACLNLAMLAFSSSIAWIKSGSSLLISSPRASNSPSIFPIAAYTSLAPLL